MSAVQVEVRDDIAHVILNRPPVNALDESAYRQLTDIFESVTAGAVDGPRVIVLSAGGPHFCAGTDIDELISADVPAAERSMRAARQAFDAVYRCPLPVVAVVHGAVLGAGVALAAASDLIVTADSAQFGLPEIEIGLTGGVRHLARLVHPGLAREMYLTGQRFRADDLEPWARFARICPADQLARKADELATLIARNPRSALTSAKESILAGEYLDLRAANEAEHTVSLRLIRMPEARSALEAFRTGPRQLRPE